MVGPTELLQVTFAFGMCHPTGEELSDPAQSSGQGLCVVSTVAGEKMFCYELFLSPLTSLLARSD